MRLAYDLHIHSTLSPCAEETMTPNNIVNMSVIKELDVIAITDHNASRNAKSAVEVALRDGLDIVVIPGMEVETAEEIHVVVLFKDVETAETFEQKISATLPPIKNRTDIFGEQRVMNAQDEVIDIVENLLATASALDISEVMALAFEMGGVAIPAHVDRSSYSVLSSLGFLSEDLHVQLIEISKMVDPHEFLFEKRKLLGGCHQFLWSSDAHRLEDINEREVYLEAEERTAESVISALRAMCQKD